MVRKTDNSQQRTAEGRIPHSEIRNPKSAISVRVRQAHEVPQEGGGYVRYYAGQEIEIPEDQFCANLHELLSVSSTESTE